MLGQPNHFNAEHVNIFSKLVGVAEFVLTVKKVLWQKVPNLPSLWLLGRACGRRLASLSAVARVPGYDSRGGQQGFVPRTAPACSRAVGSVRRARCLHLCSILYFPRHKAACSSLQASTRFIKDLSVLLEIAPGCSLAVTRGIVPSSMGRKLKSHGLIILQGAVLLHPCLASCLFWGGMYMHTHQPECILLLFNPNCIHYKAPQRVH